MAEPFIGEIIMVGFNFAPRGWAFCNGQLLQIQQNAALFSLLGTTYGGNGVQTFGLPDLRGRVPIHFGQGPGLSNYVLGQHGGAESVTLTVSNLPAHAHALTNGTANVAIGARSETATTASPAGGFLGHGASNMYVTGQTAPNTGLNGGAANISGNTNPTGSSVPASILQPYLCLNFVIALEGIYPSRN